MHSYPSSNAAIVASPASEKNDTATHTAHRAAGVISRTIETDNISSDGSRTAEKLPFKAVKEGQWLIPKAEEVPADAVLIQIPHHPTSSTAKPKKPYGGEYRPINGIRNGNQTGRKYGKGYRESLFSSCLHANAKSHEYGGMLKPDHKSILDTEHHVKRRRIEGPGEILLDGNRFIIGGTDKSNVIRWPGYLAEKNHDTTSDSLPSDFTMGKAAEFNKVENNFNPRRNNRTKCKPSNKGSHSSHPSTASSPIGYSSINGTKNSPILLADDSKSVDNFIAHTSISPINSKTHFAEETSEDLITNVATPTKGRSKALGDAASLEDTVPSTALRSSPIPIVKSEKIEVAKDIRARHGMKKHRNSVDELQGDCNVTPSRNRAQDSSPEHLSSRSNSFVVLKEPSRKDGPTKVNNKHERTEPVNISARDVWPLHLYRTDLDDYPSVLLGFDERKRHFEIKLHEEKDDKEIVDRSRINRMRYSAAGTKVVIDGPRKKDLATIHAFDFEQYEHCECFVRKIEDIGICGSSAVQQKDASELDRIFDDVGKKRQERKIRRLSNEKRAEQDLISDERFQKAMKRRSSLSCPDSESKRLRSENSLYSEIASESIPQRRSARYLSHTNRGENSTSHKPSSKPEDLEKKVSEQTGTQKLEPWSEPIIYPSTGVNRTTVEFEDVFRLEDGEFLNDNIISFYLRYLYEYSGQNKDKVYIFNTYFFSRLTSGVKRDIDYEAVEKWTSKVNIFNYEYLVVPVNHSLHWYLVIIYNSSHKEKVMNRDQSEASLLMAESKAMWPSENKVECIANSDSALEQDHKTLGLRKDLHRLALSEISSTVDLRSLEESKEMLLSDVDGFDVSEDNVSKYFIESNGPGTFNGRLKPIHNDEKGLKNGSSPYKATPKGNKGRFFLISLDSFGESRPQVLRALKLYLVQEARSKHKFELEFDQKTFRGATAKGIPLQYNGCDCGVYLLDYAEKFMQNPRQFMEKLINKEMSIKEDWPEISPRQTRKRIRERLCEVQKAQESRRQRRLTAKREGSEKINTKISKSDKEEPKPSIQLHNSDSPELIHATKVNNPNKQKVEKQIDSSVSEIILENIPKPSNDDEPSTIYSPTASKAIPSKQGTTVHKQNPFFKFCRGVKAAGAESVDGHS